LLTFCLVIMISILYKWIKFDGMLKRKRLHDKKVRLLFSKMVFNGWDWSTDDSYENGELRRIVTNEVRLTLYEENIKKVVKGRSKSEKCKLYLRRAGAMFINFLVLCVGWAGIISVNFYSNDISTYFDTKVLSYIVFLFPAHCYSLHSSLLS